MWRAGEKREKENRVFSKKTLKISLPKKKNSLSKHSQAMRARLRELKEVGVPVTNYGLLLSAAAGIEAFERVVLPWGVEL